MGKKNDYGDKKKNYSSEARGKKKIESILAQPGVTTKGNFRITEMLYPVYPKMRLTSTRQIRPCVGDVEGIATIYLNVS
jgi:hypothetical protein